MPRIAPSGKPIVARDALRRLLVLLLIPIGCAPPPGGEGVPVPVHTDAGGVAGPAAVLLLQGRINPDTVVLEPVLRLEQAASAATSPHDGAAAHRVTGFDARGVTLFTRHFSGTALSGRPGEEHFNVVVSLPDDQAARLSRLVLVAADGRNAVRTASLSSEAFAVALRADEALQAQRLDGGRVRLRWDDQLFLMVMVRDPETRDVLSLARGGEVTVLTNRTILEVTVSEGVRSGTRQVRVR
jgi:hypothetical protein